MPDKDCRTCKYGHYSDHWGLNLCHNVNECKGWELWEPQVQTYKTFEDCKKIMIQYLEAKNAVKKLMEKCATCKERICHCNECPMMIDNKCRFDE